MSASEVSSLLVSSCPFQPSSILLPATATFSIACLWSCLSWPRTVPSFLTVPLTFQWHLTLHVCALPRPHGEVATPQASSGLTCIFSHAVFSTQKILPLCLYQTRSSYLLEAQFRCHMLHNIAKWNLVLSSGSLFCTVRISMLVDITFHLV